MIKFDNFYYQCPRCKSWMEGHLLITSMINQSILYSDGKVLNDGYITEHQKMIVCPACNHWSWVEKYEEPYISKTKPQEHFYTWNSWRFYGVHFGSNEGRLALVNHYKNFLAKSDYDRDQEIYFRRMMWWAYNDLIRNRYQINIERFTSKEMSFKVWWRNRKRLLQGIDIFLQHHQDYVDNLSKLVELLKDRYTPDDEEYEATNLDIIEMYRQLGDFNSANALLDKTTRRTYFISTIEKKVDENDDLVFLVTG